MTAHAARAVTFLASATHRWPHLGTTCLYPLLRENPQLAVDAGSAALTVLSGIGDLDMAILEAIEPCLPEHAHVDLDPGIAAVTQRLTGHRLALTDDPAIHAQLKLRLSWRNANAGWQDQALAPAEDAVGLYRRLAEADPAAFLPNLAGALSELSLAFNLPGPAWFPASSS